MKKNLVFPAILLLLLTGIYFTTPVSALVWQDQMPDDEKAFLGITMMETKDGKNDETGVYIFQVSPGSAASKAGLLRADVITHVDGTKITTPDQLSEIIASHKPGDTITMTITRNEVEQKLTVKLQARENRMVWISKIMPELKGKKFHVESAGNDFNFNKLVGGSRYHLGIEFRELDAELAPFFKAEGARGVVVMKVEDESPAAEAGMKVGDVVLSIEGRKVEDQSDLINALSVREENAESLSVSLLRNGSKMDLQVKAEKGGFYKGFSHGSKAQLISPEGYFSVKDRDGAKVIIKKLHKSDKLSELKVLHELNEIGENEHILMPKMMDMLMGKKGPMSLAIIGDDLKTSLQIHEDGSVTFNDKNFEDMDAFKKYMESEEGLEYKKGFEAALKEKIKIRIHKSDKDEI